MPADSSPIWPTWTGPFPDSASRPLQPDFTLPDCYTVTNIHRVRDKLPGFSDETLFWIFYTQPMDILQDVAAAELYVNLVGGAMLSLQDQSKLALSQAIADVADQRSNPTRAATNNGRYGDGQLHFLESEGMGPRPGMYWSIKPAADLPLANRFYPRICPVGTHESTRWRQCRRWSSTYWCWRRCLIAHFSSHV